MRAAKNGDHAAVLRSARAALHAGRLDHAHDLYERIARGPALAADDWFNLGYLRRIARRFDDALHAYGKALAAGVGRPEEVHLNCALILADHLGRPDAAHAALDAAIAADPRYLPARLNRAQLHEDHGDVAAARAAYRAALRIAPGTMRATARLAMIDVHEGDIDAALARLQAAAGDPRDMDGMAERQFALGHALDAAGRHDEAFAAFAEANAAAAELAAAAGATYDRRGAEAMAARMTATFPLKTPPSTILAAAGTNPSHRPVFIMGMFRSGSTILEQMLGAHPAVTTGGELEAWPALMRGLPDHPGPADVYTAEVLARLRSGYLRETRALAHGTLLTDKRPDNFIYAGLIKAALPEARIIWTRRRTNDIILSVWLQRFEHAVPYAHDLTDIAHWLGLHDRLLDHWRAAYGDDIHVVDYERLVEAPRETMSGVLGHLQLAWDDACLSPHRNTAAVRTASLWQVRQPLHRRSAERERHYRTRIEAILGRAGSGT